MIVIRRLRRLRIATWPKQEPDDLSLTQPTADCLVPTADCLVPTAACLGAYWLSRPTKLATTVSSSFASTGLAT